MAEHKPNGDLPAGASAARGSLWEASWVKWIVAALPPGAGVLLLVFKDEIHASWPVGPWPGTQPEPVWPAAFYWAFLVGWFVLFIVSDRAKDARDRQQSEDQRGALKNLNDDLEAARREHKSASDSLEGLQRRAHAEQQEATRKIREALETLPDKTFRGEFARKAGHLQRYVTLALGSALVADDLRVMIRGLLSDIAGLASTYGPNEDAVMYRAHIMEYDDIVENEMTLALSPASAAARGYDGVLVLRRDLAATMATDEGDESLVDAFAFGVRRADKLDDVNGKLTVMPGPQLVFAQGEFRGIMDVNAVDELKKTVRDDVVDSFKNWRTNPFRGSLVSFPLAVPVGRKDRTRIGVVTIHADKAKMIGGHEERWRIFALLMRPYMDGVASMLSRLQELEN